ncbi:MAG: hypothetical protein M3P29_10765, partial [Acidobacteriota bacterium]|nr:hypothetical protein [Acidobacteriota bacterium]
VAIDSSLHAIIINGAPIPLIGDLGGGVFGPLPAGSVVPLSAQGALAQGYGLPPALKTIPPFSSLPHVGEPLRDQDWISPTELATFTQRINDYNAAIVAAAAARDIPVADITGLFNSFQNGVTYGGVTLAKAFISGGIFSNDGTHLSDIGYTLFANQYIKAIDAGYGTKIPVASLGQFFTNNGQTFGFGSSQYVIISPEAAKNFSILWTMAPQQQPALPPARRRASQ